MEKAIARRRGSGRRGVVCAAMVRRRRGRCQEIAAHEAQEYRRLRVSRMIQLTTGSGAPIQRVEPQNGQRGMRGLSRRVCQVAPLWAIPVDDPRARREQNPLLSDVASNSAGLVAVKAASTVAVIWGTEKLWKRNRVAAVVLMVGVNCAMAAVVARNYRVHDSL